MLRQSETIVIHPVFGRIRIEEKFTKVLQLKYFRDLAFKSQLGSKSLSPQMLNAKHTRLLHSIGVMHLTSKLLDVCQKKFSKYFEITGQEREVLLLAALGHDLGHVAFSHSLEDRNMKTHEERTIEYFQELQEEINDIFGYDIVSKVIGIYKDNIDIKNQGNEFKVEDKLDILFIFKSLLIGSIDCDRMEYIVTDKFNVLGEKANFQEIFEYITIVLLNDFPTVGFEKDAVPLIEEMLLSRFNQYSTIYYDEDSTLIEMALKEYKKISCWNEKKIVSKTEYEILSELNNILCYSKNPRSKKYRLAQIILEGNRDNILFKKFHNSNEYEYFLEKLTKITQRKIKIYSANKKVTIYNPNKNKIYIKDDDGVIKDIMEVSSIIRDIFIDYGYVMVDLEDAEDLLESEVRDIKSLFLDNPVEIEKKFVLGDAGDSIPGQDLLQWITTCLQEIPGVEIREISEWKEVKNEDCYFEPITKVPDGLAMRLRITGEEEYYYVKIPANDKTTITKRYEEKFTCKNLSEFVQIVTGFCRIKGYEIDTLKIKQGVKITTHRYKDLVKVQGSLIEIACDFSVYEYQDKISNGMMLECELKEGDDISLWYLTKHLKKKGFIETNESKQIRAKKALGLI